MSDEQWSEVVKNNEMINDVLLKLGERLEHLEKYVQALPTPDKTMYRPPNHEDYLNIKENYDLIYKRIEALENGMQETE
tara:strand:+ start:296 stop:532 length:237 start_codon:yes stop_codon:yes gene_type:complete